MSITAPSVPAPAASSLSPALKAYVTEVRDAIQDIPDALESLGEGSTQAANDPGLSLTDTWKARQAVSLARVVYAAARISKIENVPPQAEHLHSLYVELASEIDAMAAVYTRGIEQNSVGDLYAANEHIARINEIVPQCTTEILTLTKHASASTQDNPSGYGDRVHSLAALLDEVSQIRFENNGEFDGRSEWELTLVRNAPYARHGYRFHEAKLLAFFKKQSWYHPSINSQDRVSTLLSAVEQQNIETIHNYQNAGE